MMLERQDLFTQFEIKGGFNQVLTGIYRNFMSLQEVRGDHEVFEHVDFQDIDADRQMDVLGIENEP